MPPLILRDLVDGFTRRTADRILAEATGTSTNGVTANGTAAEGTPARDRLVLDSAFGRVVAWLWQTDRSRALTVLSDIAVLIYPSYQLVDLLDGLRYALPDSFGDYNDLSQAAQDEAAMERSRGTR